MIDGPRIPPASGGPAKSLVVFLHGYGADGNDLIGLGMQWGELFPGMLFVSPNAPYVCVNNPMGFEWFPLNDDDRAAARIAGADAVRPVIINFLIDLWAQTGLSAKDTVLAGFSQGAMMALNVGLSLDQPLAGVLGFSGAFVPPEGFEDRRFAKPPVALVHGSADQVLTADLSRQAATTLTAAGIEVTLHISPGAGHGIAEDGLEFATAFLLAAIGGKG